MLNGQDVVPAVHDSLAKMSDVVSGYIHVNGVGFQGERLPMWLILV
jgi:hypothetical protein